MKRFFCLICILLLFPLCFAMVGCTTQSDEPQVPDDDKEQPDESVDTPSEDDPPAEQAPTPKYEGYSTPCVVETLYTEQIIVADAVLTDKPYRADPTGAEDATKALQKAIDRVYEAGGGTVYLPAGTYRITAPIVVHPFVSLVGDYNVNPDGAYGTVILADVVASEDELPALFTIGGSAGVVGLVVYYPEQSMEDVKPYPYTFCIPGSTAGPAYYMLSTVENCTVVNGYRGIYAGSVNEQMNISGVRGTFLVRALELYDSADASVIEYVDADASYWARSPLGGADKSAIERYTAQHGEAFVFGDLEWVSFRSLRCSDYATGIHIVKGPRAKFSGLFYQCEILSCDYGLVVDDIDNRLGYGLAMTGGTLEGYSLAAINNTDGKVQLTDVAIEGELGTGTKEIVVNDVADLSYPDGDPAEPRSPEGGFTVVKADKTGATNASAVIQKALDSLAASGGIVYLPAGAYRMEKPLVIPAGVELRGSGTVPTRDQMELSLGTMLFCLYGGEAENGEGAAAITLGEGSALRNVRVINSGINVLEQYGDNGNAFPARPWLIRGTGNNISIVGCAFAGAIRGIELVDAPNHYVAHLTASAYDTLIRIENSDTGYIGAVLTNVTVGMRNRWWGLANYRSLFPNGWEKNFEEAINESLELYTTVHLEMDELTQLEYVGSKACLAVNVFSYGAMHTVTCEDSSVDAINLGRDSYWRYEIQKPMLVLNDGSSLNVFNQHRFNGVSYEADGDCSLSIYSRVTIYADEGCVEQ
ncbi:MAG: hypothetical protein IJW97_07670 [Clostridia bacterium]|nr:hypothetical protein [Clostridia bacterium]